MRRCRIVDAFSKETVLDGRRGEIMIRGPSLMNGYLGNHEATEETIKDGWVQTGDVGYHKDGKLYIVERAKVSQT